VGCAVARSCGAGIAGTDCGAAEGRTGRHLPAVGFLFVELFGEVCGANIFVAHALGHDAVVESDNGVAAALFREPRIPAAFRCLRRGPLD